MLNITNTILSGMKIIEPRVFSDERGFFLESFQVERIRSIGITEDFVQDNISRSKYGVLRGLHYQLKYPQGKLVTVIRGEVFDVSVDIRLGSPTFGKWFGVILNDTNHKHIYIPPGFAHGFCVLSDQADFYYKCTDYYHPEDECGVLWNDANIEIEWPKLTKKPVLSVKDSLYNILNDIPAEKLPKF